jgi:predicted HTH transcriptional regulator
VAQGESATLEFKSTARKTPELEKIILRTVAGFLNAQGGTLLIGIADDGTTVGLEADFKSLGKKGRDGFELFLIHLLLDNLGKDLAPYIQITFHPLDGQEVCRIQITPAPASRIAYVREGNDEVLYLRTGNATRRLSAREAVDYATARKG